MSSAEKAAESIKTAESRSTMTIEPVGRADDQSSITLDDIIKTTAFGPVRIGATLRGVGTVLGPPEDWLFTGDDDDAVCVMRYANVEVYFRISNRTSVFYARIDLTRKFHGDEILFARDKNFPLPHIKLPPLEQRTFSHLKNTLEANSLGFKIDSSLDFDDVPNRHIVMESGLTLFFDAADDLAVISIGHVLGAHERS